MSELITSPQNSHIKDVVRLEKRGERTRRGQTLVEGVREVTRALAAGVVPGEAYVCADLVSEPLAGVVQRLEQLDRERRTRLYFVTPAVYARLAMREESGGIVLVIPQLDVSLARLPQRQPQFYAVVEEAEKPGNIGAILRTADAAGVDGVIVCGGVDLYNPNVVRASLGTLFTVPVAEANSAAAIAWLHDQGVQIVAATPAARLRYTAADFTGPTAIVMGSEAHGLSAAWLAAADVRVSIPMHGEADSLNLSASTAILLYEVVRQRGDPPSEPVV